MSQLLREPNEKIKKERERRINEEERFMKDVKEYFTIIILELIDNWNEMIQIIWDDEEADIDRLVEEILKKSEEEIKRALKKCLRGLSSDRPIKFRNQEVIIQRSQKMNLIMDMIMEIRQNIRITNGLMIQTGWEIIEEAIVKVSEELWNKQVFFQLEEIIQIINNFQKRNLTKWRNEYQQRTLPKSKEKIMMRIQSNANQKADLWYRKKLDDLAKEEEEKRKRKRFKNLEIFTDASINKGYETGASIIKHEDQEIDSVLIRKQENKYGESNSFNAEAQVVLTTLERIVQKKWEPEKITFKGDNQALMDILEKGEIHRDILQEKEKKLQTWLLYKIHNLEKKLKTINYIWIPRELNSEADFRSKIENIEEMIQYQEWQTWNYEQQGIEIDMSQEELQIKMEDRETTTITKEDEIIDFGEILNEKGKMLIIKLFSEQIQEQMNRNKKKQFSLRIRTENLTINKLNWFKQLQIFQYRYRISYFLNGVPIEGEEIRNWRNKIRDSEIQQEITYNQIQDNIDYLEQVELAKFKAKIANEEEEIDKDHHESEKEIEEIYFSDQDSDLE